MNRPLKPPPDQPQRDQALDPARSVLVQAPAGSGKTDLLTRRFLRLLTEVEDPGQIVAITFTKAAAAEMRNRILGVLEKAAAEIEVAPQAVAPSAQTTISPSSRNDFSMATLAHRALTHSRNLNWNLLDLPAQLRITTIDAFCRELALQQPLLSGLGGGLDISNPATELHRRAARKALEAVGTTPNSNSDSLAAAIGDLLLWRDNNWQELEDLLVAMLKVRDRWMHDFLVDLNPDWDDLRARLERPFANAVRTALDRLMGLLDRVTGCRDEALALARFACEEPGAKSPRDLAELAELPASLDAGFQSVHEDCLKITAFLLTKDGTWRKEKGLTVNDGFPLPPEERPANLASALSSSASTPSTVLSPRSTLCATCLRPATPKTIGASSAPASCFSAAPPLNSRSSSPKPPWSTTPKSPRSRKTSSGVPTAFLRTPPSSLPTAYATCSSTNFKTPQPPPTPASRLSHRRMAR